MKPKRRPITEQEQRQLDRIHEADIYFDEHERIDHVPNVTEGLGYDGDESY